MRRCSKKEKLTCDGSIYDECVLYQGTVNTQSELQEEDCLTIGETTQDIYNQLEEINVSDIDDCLEYQDKKIKTVVKKHGQEICDIKTQLESLKDTALCNTNIKDCGIDFKCLETTCGNEIQTLKDWIQAVTNKICE